jgi:hypothetical protein
MACCRKNLHPRQLFIKYGGTTYYIGDKVMQIKNNYDKNVFNGDIGFIEAIDQEDRTIVPSPLMIEKSNMIIRNWMKLFWLMHQQCIKARAANTPL